jgi:restriction system protein
MSKPVFWGVHGGRTGDADDLFLKRGYVALGWTAMGNLATLGADREQIKNVVAAKYPEKPAGAIPIIAGQLFRFVHEMKPGDYLIYPSKQDRKVHLGRVEGAYQYDPAISEGYPSQRKAAWVAAVDRSAFTPAALFEIGSAMSLFKVTTHAAEFGKHLNAPVVPAVAAEPDVEELALPIQAAVVEESTEDFVLRQLSTELKGHPLASLVADLLRTMGFRTRVSPPGADQGIDIVAHRDELGLERPVIRVQVKSGAGNVGDQEVSAFSAKVADTESGLFVTLGSYSTQAQNTARSQPRIRLVGGPELVAMILEHYEDLLPKYKTLIPLRQVYVRADAYEGD